MSPTDCVDDARRLNIARRLGSAIMPKTDSIVPNIQPQVYTCQGILRIADVMPHTVAPAMGEMIEQGLKTMKQTLERS